MITWWTRLLGTGTGRPNIGHKTVPTKWDSDTHEGRHVSNIDPDAQEDVTETYGPCIRFHRCRNIGTLGNGLCISCWDGTNKKVE